MTVSTPGLSGIRRAGAAALAAVALGFFPGARAEAAGDTLPLGDAGLTEVRDALVYVDGQYRSGS
ncbi:hypothetical protein [Micromonospora sp. NPDC005173]|uniref:hypothetical protein n=1 Tax=Micromonospora sp. NPDC005173 TaxID=3157165 RepID=UPI0033BB12E9